MIKNLLTAATLALGLVAVPVMMSTAADAKGMHHKPMWHHHHHHHRHHHHWHHHMKMMKKM
jgi:hypothetical protein